MKRSKTPNFLLELPLVVTGWQVKRLRVHFEAARCLYKALLGAALARLNRMQADPAWQPERVCLKVLVRTNKSYSTNMVD